MVAPVLVAIVLSAFLVLPLLACDASAAAVQDGFSTTVRVAADGSSVFPTISDGGGLPSSDPGLVIDDASLEALDAQVDSAVFGDPMTIFLFGGMTLVFVALVRRLRVRPIPGPVEVRVRARR